MTTADIPFRELPSVTTARSAPRLATLIGMAVGPSGAVPRQLGLNRRALEQHGFAGRVGQTMVIPRRDGATLVAVGVGDAPTPGDLRDAAAAFVRAAGRHGVLACDLVDAGSSTQADASAVTEGLILASYRYPGITAKPSMSSSIESVTIFGSASSRPLEAGVRHGSVTARAAALARDLANTPPAHLNARDIADLAVSLGQRHGFGVEVFDNDDLVEMGCGGLLGVNRGSTEPARLVRLTFEPSNPKGHVALVGKGVMYDSGGISLKPSDAFHVVMKMDMSGAAAVLSTMTALRDLRCRTRVTGYLVCTDNMPSGSALKLGDVLTMRNGKSVEIHNTDAEGRLILADGLSLAVEDGPDAIFDIATLTGAAMAALGPEVAAVLGNDQATVDRIRSASSSTDEPVWQMPLESTRYRKLLDSVAADMRNIGGPYGGCITAAIFLSEFVGDVPWAHIDIAGPMKVDGDESWRSKGATGFGTRLLIDTVINW
ncbi:MAG: leucyl aminopeptidase [Acidimicrobiia bacterium]|nr:leucyl aminopeptidase [Acidimicrobiia bacterium]